jgi:ribosomal protein S26
MEPVCFLCQEYEIDIGHQTILCPKQFCKICQQKGHFAMNCKTFCKDFVTNNEQMVKLENEDETKTEIHFDDLPFTVEPKAESCITFKKELIKSENKNHDEFSKSEEVSLMYCLESMPPKDTKKRKIDSDLIVENDLTLEAVQQKIIEKLNILNQLHQSEIKDLRQRMSKNAFIIGKQSKELKFLIECKKELKIELDDIYQDLQILGEDKKEMELELNDVIGKLKGIS